MNILLNKFPNRIEINDKEFEINSDFRIGLEIVLMFEDATMNKIEQLQEMCNLLYKNEILEEDFEEACKKATKFLDCGEVRKVVKENQNEEDNDDEDGRLYSFEKDAKYIYSAIKQTHHIDLESIENLHWWKFIYMFMDLDKDCFFSQILHLRSQKQKGKLTKDEALVYHRMRDILDLNYTDEDGEPSEFEQLLKGSADIERYEDEKEN